MKVFISWSGTRSKALAAALREYLPMVLQYVEPFVSDKDIAAGERWAQTIAGELEASNFGIICITPENLNSEWVLFESGALSKSMQDGKVIPFLLGLELTDLSGPLSQFQAQKVSEAGFAEVIKAINKVAEKPALHQIVDRLVPSIWPQLNETLAKIPEKAPTEKHKRQTHEVLEELVTGVRGLSAGMRDADFEGSDRDRFMRRRRMRFHPHMVNDIVFSFGEHDKSNNRPLSLLLVAGFVRDEFPWLAELLNETYREIRDGTKDEGMQSLSRLRHVVRHTMHQPLIRELGGGSKDNIMMIEEVSLMLEMFLSRLGKSLSGPKSKLIEDKEK